jgi:uncharacterized protein (TIGR03067 family)
MNIHRLIHPIQCGLSILCVWLLAGTCRMSSAADASEAKALDGLWIPIKAELAGQPMADAVLKTITLKIENGRYEVMVGGALDAGTVTLESYAHPKAMKISGVKGPNAGKVFPAIYELKSGTLRVCYDLSGAKTPTEFKTSPGTQLYLVTYRRQAADHGNQATPR